MGRQLTGKFPIVSPVNAGFSKEGKIFFYLPKKGLISTDIGHPSCGTPRLNPAESVSFSTKGEVGLSDLKAICGFLDDF